MTVYYGDDQVTLHLGDAVEVMRSLPDKSVDCVVTSPPYAMQRASTYGGIAEVDYPKWTVTWMHACARLLKPNGSVALNISPHVHDGQLSDYVMRSRLALRDAGWFEHDELVWVKPDKLPTGHVDWPVRAWESVFWYSLTKRPFCEPTSNGNTVSDYDRRRMAVPNALRGRASRLDWDHAHKGGRGAVGSKSKGKNWTSISVRTIGNEVDHPAPYPTQLAQWLMQFFCPIGGTVLDPFSGSGTTGLAAQRTGRRYVGIDINPDYHDLALKHRLNQSALDFEEPA